jgi:hypothetical protein
MAPLRGPLAILGYSIKMVDIASYDSIAFSVDSLCESLK